MARIGRRRPLIVAASAVVLTLLGFVAAEMGVFDPAPLFKVFEQHPFLAAGLYLVAFFVANALTLPTGLPLNLGAGVLWGAVGGGLMTVLAAAIFAAAAFLVSRRMGYGRRHSDTALLQAPAWYRRWIGDREWLFVVFLRLNPLVPFGLASYLLGLSPMRFRTYIIATVLGNAPASLAIASLGHAIGAFTLFGAYRALANDIILSFTALSAVIGVAAIVERALAARTNAASGESL